MANNPQRLTDPAKIAKPTDASRADKPVKLVVAEPLTRGPLTPGPLTPGPLTPAPPDAKPPVPKPVEAKPMEAVWHPPRKAAPAPVAATAKAAPLVTARATSIPKPVAENPGKAQAAGQEANSAEAGSAEAGSAQAGSPQIGSAQTGDAQPGMDWEDLIGADVASPIKPAAGKSGAIKSAAVKSAALRGSPLAIGGSAKTAGRGRRANWLLPLTLVGILAAGGFVGFAVYTFNHQPAADETPAAAITASHQEESISKGIAKPATASTANRLAAKPLATNKLVANKQSQTGRKSSLQQPGVSPFDLGKASSMPPNSAALPTGNDSDGSLAGLISGGNLPSGDNSSKSAASDSPADTSGAMPQTVDRTTTADGGDAEKPTVGTPNSAGGNKAPIGPAASARTTGTTTGTTTGMLAAQSTSGSSVVFSAPRSRGAIESTLPPGSAGPEFGDDQLLDLFNRKKLFAKTSYPGIRHIFAQRFEDKHQPELRKAFGADFDKTMAWLAANPDIKEELFLAIDERHNNIVGALSLFQEIKERFSEKIVPYANLAIATAVTWDRGGSGIYDYLFNAQLTKSKPLGKRLDAIGNFDYLLAGERLLGDRLRLLPWEFLVHVVNHRTPLAERKWAVENYFAVRSMFGKCYKDVPYDMEMLNTNFAKAKLNGQDYTLENLREFGGVCAEQADFASRVGKSMGVPSEFVHGESTFGELHAWVMWVELTNVTKTGIAFSLESYGRYSYDKYYVGHLEDPRTGQDITDRELELRLQAVGADPIAHRQAALVMRAYPMLRDKTKMTIADELKFLDQAMKLSPWLEEPWLEVAKMSHEGQLGKEHGKQMLLILDRLFTTFAAVPDFTWRVFDDLITFQTIQKQRGKLYERLVALYEQAGRPDLSCEARLKYVDQLVQENRYKDAIEGLAFTIKKFPDEARYVPRMLDRLDSVCQESKLPHVSDNLVLFYRDYLPMVPQARGDRVSPFCVQMYERGIAIFKSAGNKDLADMYTAQLAKLKAGKS